MWVNCQELYGRNLLDNQKFQDNQLLSFGLFLPADQLSIERYSLSPTVSRQTGILQITHVEDIFKDELIVLEEHPSLIFCSF